MTMPASDQTALDEDGDFDFQRAHYMQKELLICRYIDLIFLQNIYTVHLLTSVCTEFFFQTQM